MAEDPKTAQPVTPVTPSAPPAASPVAAPSSDAPKPVVAEPKVEAPKVEAAPVAEAPKTDAKPEAPKIEEPGAKPEEVKPHTETPTLLETVGKDGEKPKAETKPGDKPEPKVETKPDEKPPEAPKPVYELKAPEGYPQFEPAMLEPAIELFTKHKIGPEVAQELMNLHAGQMKSFVEEYAKQTLANQHKVFAETRANWRKEIQADEIMGGAAYQTASRAVKRMLNLFVPQAEEKAFNDFMRLTGAGDHPAFWRLLHRMSQKYDEGAPTPPAASPPPDRGRTPGRGARRAALYDHPRSHNGANGAA